MDTFIMRVVDVVYCFPVLFLVIIIATILKPSIYNIMIIIGLCNWTGTARFVRGEILRGPGTGIRSGLHLTGGDGWTDHFHHIIPNIMAPIIVEATLQMARPS